MCSSATGWCSTRRVTRSKGAWVGTPDELRVRAEAAAASGITELLYTPSGPDMARELRAFAAAFT